VNPRRDWKQWRPEALGQRKLKDVKPVRYSYGITAALLAGGAVISLITGQPAGAQVAQNDEREMRGVVPRAGAPESFAELTEQLAPAVVNISTRQRVQVESNPVAGTPFEGLFGNRGGGVEEPLAVDAEVEDVLHEAGRLVPQHALVLRALLGLGERAAHVLDRLSGAAATDPGHVHVVLLGPYPAARAATSWSRHPAPPHGSVGPATTGGGAA
jgi:hypothetical protein